jgi:RecA/RadA recombinase
MVARPYFDDEFATPGEYARQYRSLALQIVPGFMPGESKGPWKRPLLKQWTQYQDVLVTDEVFAPWYGPLGQYRQRPNMGFICGKASGNLFVIDLDVHKKPEAAVWWEGIMATHNNRMALETAEQRTGGGGRQILFYAPAGYRTPTCKTSIGVDIRGQGGFAVVAPSIHDSGAAYAWKDGLAPWDEAGIMVAPDWLLREIEKLVAEHGGDTGAPRQEHRSGAGGNGQATDGFGHATDMREQIMVDLIWAALIDWRREAGSEIPDLKFQLAKEAEKYPLYEDKVAPRLFDPSLTKSEMLDREGRGRWLFHVKWQYAMRSWNTKIAEEAAKPKDDDSGARARDWSEEFAKAKTAPPPPAGLYELLSVRDLKALPDPAWLVTGMVVEQSMGFIFGPPGCLKTFIALGMALSLTAGRPTWWGRSVQRKGAVIYICSEGTKSLKFRIEAWERHFKVSADDSPFLVIRQNINFMQGDDVLKLLHTVQAAVDRVGPVAAVFVDTVSRVLPGAEENLQKDMTLFVAACDAVRQTFGATVIGLHHTNANGGFRGSTVMPGAGDFLVEVRREPGAMVGSVYAQKIKDDEDGWEQTFKVTKVNLAGIVPRTSLVVDSDAVPEQREGDNKDSAPFDIREQILRELDKAWCAGKPWSHAENTARAAVNVLMKRWGLNRKIAKGILDTWLAKEIIEEAVFSTKGRVKGYRKMKDL